MREIFQDYQVILDGGFLIVHRGVSQKKILRQMRQNRVSAEEYEEKKKSLLALLARKAKTVEGVTFVTAEDKKTVVTLTPEAVKTMAEKNLVIVTFVCGPEDTSKEKKIVFLNWSLSGSEQLQTWSPNRIKKQAEKVRLL